MSETVFSDGRRILVKIDKEKDVARKQLFFIIKEFDIPQLVYSLGHEVSNRRSIGCGSGFGVELIEVVYGLQDRQEEGFFSGDNIYGV